MSVASAKFAFQIDATQSFQHLDQSSGKILASRKAPITMQDGSVKKMTIFFAADEDTVAEMQKKGLANSNHQTMNDFKRFCMASQKTLSSSQFAHSMRNVKNGTIPKSTSSKASFPDRLRIDYDAGISLPYGVFASKFSKASDSGLLIRVNNDGVETSYRTPEKKVLDLPSDEIKKLRNKYGTTQQAREGSDEKLQPSTTQRRPSDPSMDQTNKLESTPPKRHAISREKHITQRRKDIADPFVSPQPRSTHTAPREALNGIMSTDRDSDKSSNTSANTTTTTTNPDFFRKSVTPGSTGE